MISFYFLLAGCVLGWIIGFAHALDRRESAPQELDIASAWQVRQWQRERQRANPGLGANDPRVWRMP